ncbi:YhgE/Pip family protein [Lacticaseibacillus baoqingensis]|uniref:YhgE/Pip family protein n=1 Tax=Lacticaseibacillus baoqingensis TaxID=2486013 RepID=A0ABW4EAD1_9LACO|nr:YhgE/Pip domain-containing protein [Lacticaseibacillus baoqingensis]
MKNIGKLFVLDWRRLIKSPPAFLLVLALVVIPSLYCWFNVWALWDPYSNTQDLTVAVYSADEPTTFNHQKIAIGSELITQLHDNKKLGWRFVNSKKAVTQGVQSGKYYAGIVVPKDFSQDLMTIVDGKVKKPKLDYYVNEKINAIAPKITSSGASTLQSTISDQFVDTVAKTLMTEFNKAGVKLDDNLPMIRRFASLVTKTNDQLPTIESYLTEVETVRSQLPSIKQKLAAANQMAAYLPTVNTMAQKLVKANDYLPMVASAGQLAEQVQGKLPEVQQAGQQLSTVNANFSQLETGVSQAITVTKQGLNVIAGVDGTLPSLTAFGQQAQGAIATTKDQVLPQVETGLTVVQNATDAGLALIQTGNTKLSQDLTNLNAQLASLDQSSNAAADKQAMATLLNGMATRQANTASVATKLAATLTQVQASYNQLHHTTRSDLDSAIAQLKAVNTVATNVSTQAAALAQAAPSLSTAELQTRIAALQQTADQFANAAQSLQNLGLSTSVQTLIAQFKAALADADTTLADINQNVVPQLPSLLQNTKVLLQQAQGVLVKVQTQLPAVKQEIADANTLLNGHMDQITSGINTVAELYRNDFPTLKMKLAQATAFVNNDLPGIETELTTSLALANQKLPVLESGLDQAHGLIQTDWPTLKEAIQKGASAIQKGEQSIDLSALLKLLRRDAGQEADFLANPVQLKENDLYPIPTYGSQSAPFYLALCIWVGALLLGAILITEFEALPQDLAHATIKQRYVARWLTFVGLGMGQGLIAALGNIFLIGTYVVNKPLYVLFAMGLSVIFVSILYSLIALFGNIGKGIGIIILVLSISGAGGNFPVVLSGKFFQIINPWLPFTYAVNLLRETVGGIYWPNLWQDVWHLLAFGLVFFCGGLFLKGPIRPWIDKMHAITKKSKIME